MDGQIKQAVENLEKVVVKNAELQINELFDSHQTISEKKVKDTTTELQKEF